MHMFRAKDRNRTYDRLITNQLLYQLSYFGAYSITPKDNRVDQI